jgi:hypothetical protein
LEVEIVENTCGKVKNYSKVVGFQLDGIKEDKEMGMIRNGGKTNKWRFQKIDKIVRSTRTIEVQI